MSSERRRARAGDDAGDDVVPVELRRYRVSEWARPGDTDPIEPHRRWRRARREWAQAHGFGRDWSAFLAACRPGASGGVP